MKTTFKTVFTELDDEVMDIRENNSVDIDVDKIKNDVFMQINDENKSKKKFRKKFIVIIAAAVIILGGTVGAFATGSIQTIFGRIFNHSGEMNELGLFDGGNVEVTSADSSLDVKLLGITGDGEKLCSAIEITKKDGSPVIDKDYTYPAYEPFDGSSWENTLTVNGKDETQNSMQFPQYVLSDGNKTLTVYLFTTTASGLDGSLQDGRITFVSKQFHANKVTNQLASVKLPGQMDPIFDKIKNNEELSADDVLFDQEELAKKRSELGLSEEDFTTIDYQGNRIYCQAELKAFELPFAVSYDLNYRTDQFIEKDLSAETEPEIVVKNTRNAKMTVSPFSIYLSGECDADNPESPNENGLDKCFLLPEWDDTSKVTLTDGTVYYLYTNEGGEHREGENGVYHTTVHLKYSTVIGPPLEPENIFVNIKDIESVTINGDTIYRK